ncbi:NAD(P)/FAD-dependent oxidoreductase [Castellaniella defragrans]|uniref:Sulfide:quinone oxidoreductase n=2 Tax=Castellaniella defragrans TaxID=75697 RepID=A0A7W9TQF2_CASDE|nr:FAD/NAD(P)-binding oxidoreductase [Castellaniella defragrans]MBB6083892.1 sulfide:quinone oxidoreductase [Castellaniella defragrans]
MKQAPPLSRAPAPLPRRDFLKGCAGGLGALLLPPALAADTAAAGARERTPARIVIVGAGAAGLTCASLLARRLEGARITLVDARQAHYYQPGYTLVAGGIKPAGYPVSTTREHVPAGVEWVAEAAAEIDPEARHVTTRAGRILPYDFLIVACGLELDYAAIDGMDEARIGQDGLGSIYHSPEKASATWALLSRFADTGGVGVFLRPGTEMKCAGAPLKYAFITDDHLRRRGLRGKAELIYNANNKVLFSVPIVSEKVRMLFEDRGIEVHYDRILTAIDPGRRIATFSTPDGPAQLGYDFINVIPPMRAPGLVRQSPLPWREGPYAADGWIQVDPHSLRHVRYPEIFAVGDVAGVPKGKTAASVKWQAPVAVDHLVAALRGTESPLSYDGYTSCPLITRLGRAMLVEFDYRNNLVPSFPGVVAPLEELWVTWVMKTMALKPTYISMLHGHV